MNCQAMMVAFALILCCSCSQRVEWTEYGADYKGALRRQSNGADRWSVYLCADKEKRLITEAVVEDGAVVSLMPTPRRWASKSLWANPSEHVTFEVLALRIRSDGSLQWNEEIMTLNDYGTLLSQLEGLSLFISFAVEPGVSLDHVIAILQSVAPHAGQGMSFRLSNGKDAIGV